MEKHPIDKLFSDKLEGHKSELPAQMWAKIASQLEPEKEVKSLKIWQIAASLAALISLSIIWWFNANNLHSNQPIVVEPSPVEVPHTIKKETSILQEENIPETSPNQFLTQEESSPEAVNHIASIQSRKSQQKPIPSNHSEMEKSILTQETLTQELPGAIAHVGELENQSIEQLYFKIELPDAETALMPLHLPEPRYEKQLVQVAGENLKRLISGDSLLPLPDAKLNTAYLNNAWSALKSRGREVWAKTESFNLK